MRVVWCMMYDVCLRVVVVCDVFYSILCVVCCILCVIAQPYAPHCFAFNGSITVNNVVSNHINLDSGTVGTVTSLQSPNSFMIKLMDEFFNYLGASGSIGLTTEGFGEESFSKNGNTVYNIHDTHSTCTHTRDTPSGYSHTRHTRTTHSQDTPA